MGSQNSDGQVYPAGQWNMASPQGCRHVMADPHWPGAGVTPTGTHSASAAHACPEKAASHPVQDPTRGVQWLVVSQPKPGLHAASSAHGTTQTRSCSSPRSRQSPKSVMSTATQSKSFVQGLHSPALNATQVR